VPGSGWSWQNYVIATKRLGWFRGTEYGTSSEALPPMPTSPFAQNKTQFQVNAKVSFRYAYLHLLPAKLDNTNTVVASFFSPIYSPLSLSCTTLKAVSKSSFSSFVCDAFKPVATLALGFRPAYITCLRS
jgi:hypothetical protein